MMGKRIVIIQGHPDVSNRHFGHALAQEYAVGAEAGGHEVRVIDVAALDFPLLRSKEDFVVTMGMPALVYRWFFGAHGVKCLKRNILGFCGFSPVRQSLIGMVESGDGAAREKWLARMRNFGRAAK
jgi:putative NADPH-quinone reductase